MCVCRVHMKLRAQHPTKAHVCCSPLMCYVCKPRARSVVLWKLGGDGRSAYMMMVPSVSADCFTSLWGSTRTPLRATVSFTFTHSPSTVTFSHRA